MMMKNFDLEERSQSQRRLLLLFLLWRGSKITLFSSSFLFPACDAELFHQQFSVSPVVVQHRRGKKEREASLAFISTAGSLKEVEKSGSG